MSPTALATPEVATPNRGDAVRAWVKRLAPVMFWLGFVYLLAVAGLIHRADQYQVTGLELQIIFGILILLWPMFAFEAVISFVFRDRTRRVWPVVAQVIAVFLFPPARMGQIHPTTGLIWLPRLGWERPGKDLLARLDRGFGLPLLLFALLIVPILAIEYVWADAVKGTPAFAFVLHVCLGLIWVAFATDFILKLEASGRPLQYALSKWLDAAIVLLPVLEFILTFWANAAPVARLLRTTRAIAPDQLARMGQIYRLRGLLMKAWHALLALELLARLIGDNPKKRLARLEAQIASTEMELEALRAEAETVRQRLQPGQSAVIDLSPVPTAAPPPRG